jgi:hypothetical protein
MNLTWNPLALLTLAIVMLGSPRVSVSAPQPGSNPPADGAAIRQFDEAIAQYLVLRESLRSEVPGPVKDSTARQLNNASDALAGAIQRSRAKAQAGAIFSEPVAAVIKRRINEVVRTGKLAAVLAGIDDDGAASPAPSVHLRLPAAAQLATMPPSLLAVLPPLPRELEYRIVGRHLVLRDVDASMVLDYIRDAVPR